MNGGKVIVPKEIVLEWIKGDPSAFGRIVKMTMKQAYAVALSFVGNADWTISGGAYEGDYAAKSGSISDNQTSSLTIAIETTTDDQISFFKKVSAIADQSLFIE